MKNDSPSLKMLIQRYPIISFYILAYILGAGSIILIVGANLPPILALGSALSASISGMIITAIIDGRPGLKKLFSRLKVWRVGIGYWIFCSLFLAPAFLFGSLLNPLFNGDLITMDKSSFGPEILPLYISFFILAGLGQELGWTGLLTHRLKARYSILGTSMIRAALVGLWHLPIFLLSRSQHPSLAGFPYPGWISQKGFLIALLIMFLFQFLWAVLFTWIYYSTGESLLLVALLHGSEIWVAYLMMAGGISPDNLNNYWGYGGILALTALIILKFPSSKTLSRT